MDNEYLQQVKDFKYVDCEISYKKKEKICNTNYQHLPLALEILTIFKPIWVHKSSKKLYSL
jgi:hypothetical protein